MVTPVSELDLPAVTFDFADAREHRAMLGEIAKESWIAKGVFAYPILSYEDCVAILRDKRWHSAAALAASAFGLDVWWRRRSHRARPIGCDRSCAR